MNPEEAPKTPPEETPPQSVESPPAHSPAPPDKPKSKSRPVKVYLTVLFCVALLLLLISFVMQQRNHLVLQDLTTPPATPRRLPTSSWKTNVSSMS